MEEGNSLDEARIGIGCGEDGIKYGSEVETIDGRGERRCDQRARLR
jgi:hypothetical protein